VWLHFSLLARGVADLAVIGPAMGEDGCGGAYYTSLRSMVSGLCRRTSIRFDAPPEVTAAI